MINLDSFSAPLHAAVIGASGGIGQALLHELNTHDAVEKIYAFSRQEPPTISKKITFASMDICDENQIKAAADTVDTPLHIIIIASGILHDDGLSPEKTIKTLNAQAMRRIFDINTIGPALVAKHFMPLLPRDKKSVFAAISARIGSISDNTIGGWYSYRASKAALNMLIKNASIEIARKYKQAAIIGLHPGTVDTNLSKPFQGNVQEGKLFDTTQSAQYLLGVINNVSAKDTGQVFAWDGKVIKP